MFTLDDLLHPITPAQFFADYDDRKPLHVPAGSKIMTVGHYDNSTKNPNNPNDPPRETGWGEQTTDEMCLVYVGVIRAPKFR